MGYEHTFQYFGFAGFANEGVPTHFSIFWQRFVRTILKAYSLTPQGSRWHLYGFTGLANTGVPAHFPTLWYQQFVRAWGYEHIFQYVGFAGLANEGVPAHFILAMIEPFESIIIGSTGLAMAFIWLRQPCKYTGTNTFFLYLAYSR